MKLKSYTIGLLTLASTFLVAPAIANDYEKPSNALVIQTDFGLKDGAVSAMQGVAYGVNPNLKVFNLTHEIPSYDIWEASYRLFQTADYWPKGTVFVSVVDPGVGTDRKSVVLLTNSGHYFVSPDNGTLTLVAEKLGIKEVREIDETKNRLQGSEKSYTFHGRDVYAYTGARLASSAINFADVGPVLPPKVLEIDYQKPILENGTLKGSVPIFDVQYGNVWTNINDSLLQQSGIKLGSTTCVIIREKQENGKQVVRFNGKVPYVHSFGDVPEGQPLLYLNSLLNVSLALNMDSFAQKHKIKSGANTSVEIKACK